MIQKVKLSIEKYHSGARVGMRMMVQSLVRLYFIIAFIPFTSVDTRKLSPEVDKGRQLIDPILLGVSVVVHLDERDVQRVGLAVNLLQTFENLLAFGAVVSI